MISITDQAAERIIATLTENPDQGDGLRPKVRGGGCSGLQYEILYDSEGKRDRIFEHQGARVYVDVKSLIYLQGSELDYKRSLMQEGFQVGNPNVRTACGCGDSFTV